MQAYCSQELHAASIPWYTLRESKLKTTAVSLSAGETEVIVGDQLEDPLEEPDPQYLLREK